MNTLKRVFEIFWPFRAGVVISVGLILLGQALSVGVPYIQGKIIDSVIALQPFEAIITLILAGFAIHIVAHTVIPYIRDGFDLYYFETWVRNYLQDYTLRHLFSFSIGQHTNEHSGVKQWVALQGETALNRFLNEIMMNAIPLIGQVGFSTAILFWLNANVGALVLGGVMLFLIISAYMTARFKEPLERSKEMGIRISKHHHELLRNVGLIALHAKENKSRVNYNKKFSEYSEFERDLWWSYEHFHFARNVVASAAKFGAIALGVYYVIGEQSLAPGALVMIYGWTNNTFQNLGSVSRIQRNTMDAIASIKKYLQLIDTEPLTPTKPNAKRPERLEGRIEYKNVTFDYPFTQKVDEEGRIQYEVLKTINLTIEPGERVAFVGHSGAGKSTLIQLLYRAYDPTKGEILIDGRDLRELDLAWFRERLGVVEQDVALFDSTLGHNITFGVNNERTISDQELDGIAKTACIDRFYHRLEEKFETVIGERGIKLSGGERQRVGIARALIKNPAILIFDEATSHLDSENEMAIREAINKASKGRTTLIIAHRLSTIKHVDKVVVLEKGSIVGVGTHAELAKSCKPYINLIKHQATALV